MNKTFFCLLLIGLMAAGCQNSDPPDNLVEEELYIDLLTEVFLLESYVEFTYQPEKMDSLLNVLFEQYDVSRNRFERSHEYYQRQGEPQIVRIDTVRNRLQKERDKLMQARQERFQEFEEENTEEEEAVDERAEE